MQGFACSKCEGGFFFTDGACEECPDQERAVYVWLGALAGCIYIVYSLYQASKLALDVTTFTLVTSHFQISYVFLTFPFYYPTRVLEVMAPLGVISGFVFERLNAYVAPSCAVGGGFDGDYVFWWAAKAITPAAFMLPFYVAYTVISARQRREKLEDEALPPKRRVLSLENFTARRHAETSKKMSMKTIIMLVTLSLMYGINTSVKVWACTTYSDGVSRISTAPSIECSFANAEYATLFALSVVVFVSYFFGTSYFFYSISESPYARRAAADNYVTHARILRGTSLWGQVTFFFRLLWHGVSYGVRMEKRRLKGRLWACLQIIIAANRMAKDQGKKRAKRSAVEVAKEMEVARRVAAAYEAKHRVVKQLEPPVFGDCFAVKVKSPESGEWVPGLFHGFDKAFKFRVATGEGKNLAISSYDKAHICFEHNQAIEVTSNFMDWNRQADDPMNAMAAAPLGSFGRILYKGNGSETRDFDDEENVDNGVEEHVDFSVPPVSLFTFLFDLTKPVGFTPTQRWGAIKAQKVDVRGQSAVAGLVSGASICRVGGTAVRSVEKFELAITKRRLVSALLRRESIVAKKEGVTPLSAEDEALINDGNLVALIGPPEMARLRKELQKESGGRDTYCTMAFDDPRFVVTRRVPSNFEQFFMISRMKRPDPYWDNYAHLLSRFKSSSRHFEQVHAGLAFIPF